MPDDAAIELALNRNGKRRRRLVDLSAGHSKAFLSSYSDEQGGLNYSNLALDSAGGTSQHLTTERNAPPAK